MDNPAPFHHLLDYIKAAILHGIEHQAEHDGKNADCSRGEYNKDDPKHRPC